jgi:hypothetical protein
LHAYQSAVIDDNPPELRGFSVRCLKDEWLFIMKLYVLMKKLVS